MRARRSAKDWPNWPNSAKGRLPEGRRNQELTRFSRAPLVIGVISSPKENPKIPQWEMFLSGGAAAMNLVIAANALGYGTNWITNWYSDVEEGRALLGLAPHERVVGFVHIGSYAGSGARAAAPGGCDALCGLCGAVGGIGDVLRAVERPRPAARSVQGDRGAAADRLDLDDEHSRRGQSRALLLLQRLLDASASGLVFVRRRARTARPSRARPASSSPIWSGAILRGR